MTVDEISQRIMTDQHHLAVLRLADQNLLVCCRQCGWELFVWAMVDHVESCSCRG